MKKGFILSFLFLLLFFVTACSNNNTAGDDVLMDQLASDNKFHYTNESLGFSVNFPEQFIYYQTQRNDAKSIRSVEFFVPTSDREYPQDIQSYGKFLVVNVSEKDLSLQDGFLSFGEKGNEIFSYSFWQKVPNDWQDKWSDEVRNEIISSFKINQ